MWVKHHVLANPEVKEGVAQRVKVILQHATSSNEAVDPFDEGEDHSLGQEEGLFAAHRKRQKKDYGTSPALQLSHYLDISDGQNALLFWAMNMCTLPSLFHVVTRVLAVPASSAPVERVFSHAD
ncbi:hypothetical protein LDENG_00224510 [Lucifuga dentata]|nr:hypothetical protein LDENG_00224510 [Lucifuga dentata]